MECHKCCIVVTHLSSVNSTKLISRAVQKGITILNEVGLDAGIDHLLAMECFDEVHQAGCKFESFISYCGGERNILT
jgi:alpha-aminoadipic semialdehyde synthase